jgi:hypothetical protein
MLVVLGLVESLRDDITGDLDGDIDCEDIICCGVTVIGEEARAMSLSLSLSTGVAGGEEANRFVKLGKIDDVVDVGVSNVETG